MSNSRTQPKYSKILKQIINLEKGTIFNRKMICVPCKCTASAAAIHLSKALEFKLIVEIDPNSELALPGKSRTYQRTDAEVDLAAGELPQYITTKKKKISSKIKKLTATQSNDKCTVQIRDRGNNVIFQQTAIESAAMMLLQAERARCSETNSLTVKVEDGMTVSAPLYPGYSVYVK